MPTLSINAQYDGFSESPGKSYDQLDLKGGLPRSRRDFDDVESIVEVRWNCNGTQYAYLHQFYEANACNDFEEFDITLISNLGEVSTRQVRFVPRSFKLQTQQGSLFVVTASLWMRQTSESVSWPT